MGSRWWLLAVHPGLLHRRDPAGDRLWCGVVATGRWGAVMDAHLIPSCPCWECRLTRAADEAIATRWLVRLEDLVLVPAHLVAASASTGSPLPDSYQLVRGDGEVVFVYRYPRGES